MKNFFTVFFFAICISGFSQEYCFGLYTTNNGDFKSLELKPDHSYLYTANPPCGVVPVYTEKGTWTHAGDIHGLKPDAISKTTFNKCEDTLVLISASDSVVKKYLIFRIDTSVIDVALSLVDDYEYFNKIKGYYSNDTMSFFSDSYGHHNYITTYYRNGRIKEAQVYYKGKKSGDWYYYLETGELEKIEKYRRNKFRKIKYQLWM